jgi:hypothetical protein
MSTRYQVVCAVLVLSAASASSQNLTPRTPGLWQIDSTVTMAPIGGKQNHSEKLCITPEMAKRDVAPPNALAEDGWKCTSALATTAKDKASFEVHCKQGGDAAKGTGEVLVVSPKEFKGKTNIDANMEGMKVSMQMQYTGRFVNANCGAAPLMKWEGFTETPRKK